MSLDDFALIPDEVSDLHSIDAAIGIAQGFLRLPHSSRSHSTFVLRLDDVRTPVGTSRDLSDVHRTDAEHFHVGIRRTRAAQRGEATVTVHHFTHQSIGQTEEGLERIAAAAAPSSDQRFLPVGISDVVWLIGHFHER